MPTLLLLAASVVQWLAMGFIAVAALAVAGASAVYFLRARSFEKTLGGDGAPLPVSSDGLAEMREIGQRIETLVSQQSMQGETQRQQLAQQLDTVGQRVDEQRNQVDGLRNELRHEVRRRDAELEEIRLQLASIQTGAPLALGTTAPLALPEAAADTQDASFSAADERPVFDEAPAPDTFAPADTAAPFDGFFSDSFSAPEPAAPHASPPLAPALDAAPAEPAAKPFDAPAAAPETAAPHVEAAPEPEPFAFVDAGPTGAVVANDLLEEPSFGGADLDEPLGGESWDLEEPAWDLGGSAAEETFSDPFALPVEPEAVVPQPDGFAAPALPEPVAEENVLTVAGLGAALPDGPELPLWSEEAPASGDASLIDDIFASVAFDPPTAPSAFFASPEHAPAPEEAPAPALQTLDAWAPDGPFVFENAAPAAPVAETAPAETAPAEAHHATAAEPAFAQYEMPPAPDVRVFEDAFALAAPPVEAAPLAAPAAVAPAATPAPPADAAWVSMSGRADLPPLPAQAPPAVETFAAGPFAAAPFEAPQSEPADEPPFTFPSFEDTPFEDTPFGEPAPGAAALQVDAAETLVQEAPQPAAVAQEAPQPAVAEQEAPAPYEAPAGAEDLTVISSIDEHVQRLLYQAGVTTLDEIARWSRSDARRYSIDTQVSEETIMNQWIFEAQSVLFERFSGTV
jgi:predicted flap endonuclease-1-like 5' DNA nuclease